MSTPIQASPGEIVAVSTLHAGDTVLLAGDHAVTIRRVLHGSTGCSSREPGSNFALCDWQDADSAERGTACFGDEDTVRRLSEGLAA